MDIFEYQLNKNREKLNRLLMSVKQHVPYYRDNIDKNTKYYLKNYQHWCEIPVVDKNTLTSEYSRFLNDSYNLEDSSIKVIHTSGSTAMPLKIHKSKAVELRLLKKLWDVRHSWDASMHKLPVVYLYRNVDDIYHKVIRLADGERFLNLTDDSLCDYLKTINANHPKWLIGPPTTTAKLASYIVENKLDVCPLQYAELFGEMLLPFQRNIIEEAFKCKTINHYGARELGVLSYECKCGHMHAWEDFYFFEILPNKSGTKNIGQLVVTSLLNNVVPLIRYSLGDICELKQIETDCMYNNSRLELLPFHGRAADLIYTDNVITSSGILDSVFSRLALKYPLSIIQFQVIQFNYYTLNVLIIPGKNINDIVIRELENNIKSYLGEINICIKYVNSIPQNKSGKSKSFISMINMENDND